MGELALPIYAYKDKWTDCLPKLCLILNSRMAAAVGHLFLDFVDETGCIPIQVTTDKGSEIGWQYAFQAVLRESFAPDIDPLVYTVYMVLKSVHNTVIEGFWRWLKLKMGLNLKAIIIRGKQEHIFDSNIAFHVPLFYWIFVPLIQHELDEFREWWNYHRVRLQRDKNMPSGHVPAHVYEHPTHFGGIDCRIRVPKEAVTELRGYLIEEVGSRESHLGWPGVTVEFKAIAEAAWDSQMQEQEKHRNGDELKKRYPPKILFRLDLRNLFYELLSVEIFVGYGLLPVVLQYNSYIVLK
ncbi:hypothetical protein C8R44DRAFT_751464 [Mycena epipterygia]|nr:hypothetical protein C8R44DRAFT_751464 [Mycena epipterygia]